MKHFTITKWILPKQIIFKEKELRENDNQFIKEIVRENPSWTKERRLEYLNNELRKISKEYLYWVELVNSCKGWFGNSIYDTCAVPLKKQWDKIYREIQLYKNPKPITNEITDERIEEAKAYPIESLIESKKNFALCPFHNDRHPSFYIKNNYGYCFACGWTGDTIKFVRERDNLSFREAINFLT